MNRHQRRAVAVRRAPDDAALGAAAHRAGRLDEAVDVYRRALTREPRRGATWTNLGAALFELGRTEEGLSALERAAAIDPALADAHANLGFARKSLGDFVGAFAAYDRALVLDPDHADARRNRAIACLALGRGAWADYLHRDGVERHVAPRPAAPLPAALAGRRLAVLRDQGLGDELLFLRFLGALKARGAWIGYEPHPKLAPLLHDHPWIDAVVPAGTCARGADPTFSVGDLPFLTGAGDDVPPPFRIAVPDISMERARARLAALGPAPHIGATWRAGKAARNKLFKAVAPEALGRALAAWPGTVVTFQRGGGAEEHRAFESGLGRTAADLTAATDDLAECAALMAALDGYAGVSNTNVHIRAVVGKTCRVLVPRPAEFRWRAEGQSTPWFPGFALYRQDVAGDWAAALAALARDLLHDLREGVARDAPPANRRAPP